MNRHHHRTACEQRNNIKRTVKNMQSVLARPARQFNLFGDGVFFCPQRDSLHVAAIWQWHGIPWVLIDDQIQLIFKLSHRAQQPSHISSHAGIVVPAGIKANPQFAWLLRVTRQLVCGPLLVVERL